MNRVSKWSRRLSESDHGLWLIGIASFLETIIVPIPIELVLVPYMIANRRKLWRIATITTVGCLLGALFGYGVGRFLFESTGQWLIQAFDYQQAYEQFRQTFDTYGFWAILGVGITPIPFQVAMLTAGLAGYPLILFILAAVIARGIRYYGLALLVVLFGERALELWQSHSTAVGLAALLTIATLFVGLHLLSG